MSKSGQLVDKIYVAIENGNYTEAIRLCGSPEIAKFSLVQALMSFCYSCVRQPDKALQVARGVLATTPREEAVINALACTFKNCKAEKDFASCYETLITTVAGTTEHNLSELFHCYSRQKDPKKMQMMAQRLYKLTDNVKYVFWSVTSMLLQSDLPTAMFTVAEKMVRKVFYELKPNSAPGAEELHVYISILIRQGKFIEARSELHLLSARAPLQSLNDEEHFRENPNLVTVQQLFLSNTEVDLACCLADWEAVATRCRETLQQLPDQWNMYILLQSLLFARLGLHVEKHSSLSELVYLRNKSIDFDLCTKSGGDLCQLVGQHVQFLHDQHFLYPKLRGPLLAELTFLVELLITGHLELSGISISSLGQLLETYVEAMCTKYCCFLDLQPLLHKLSTTDNGREILLGFHDWLTTKRITEFTSTEKELQDRLSSVCLPEKVDNPELVTTNDASSEANKKKKKKNKGKSKPADQKYNGDIVLKTIDRVGVQEKLSKEESVLSKMCSLCQVESLFVCVAKLLNSTEFAFSEQNEASRVNICVLSQQFFVNGIGGEQRIVQPSDELMLINSAGYRWRLSSLSGSSQMLICLKWLITIMSASSNSPYSHLLKLDCLEICNKLGAGSLAWEFFQSVGIKHIQNDSCSYLVTSTLLDCSCNSELQRQLRLIQSAQSTSKRETLDMISRAFEFGNYNKVLDLSEFALHSDKSIQLLLAKAELPLIEIQFSQKTLEEAKTFLRSLGDGNLAEISSNSSLKATFDYKLLNRVDSLCNEQVQQLSAKRTLAATQRWEFESTLLQLWTNLLLETTEGWRTSVDELQTRLSSFTDCNVAFSFSLQNIPDASKQLNFALNTIRAFGHLLHDGQDRSCNESSLHESVVSSLNELAARVEESILIRCATVFVLCDPAILKLLSFFSKFIWHWGCLSLALTDRFQNKAVHELRSAFTDCGLRLKAIITTAVAQLHIEKGALIATLNQNVRNATSESDLDKAVDGVLRSHRLSLNDVILQLECRLELLKH